MIHITLKDITKAFLSAIKEYGEKTDGKNGEWFFPDPKYRPHIHCTNSYIGINSFPFTTNNGHFIGKEKFSQFISTLDIKVKYG